MSKELKKNEDNIERGRLLNVDPFSQKHALEHKLYVSNTIEQAAKHFTRSLNHFSTME
jgi:hypothetical protein